MPNRKNIMLFVDRSRRASRGLLKGIFQYSEYNQNWHFHKIPELYLRQHSIVSMIKNLGKDIHGVITYVPYNMDYEKMKLSQIPSILIPMKDIVPGTINIVGEETLTGQMAADHLLNLGLENFAFFGDDKFLWSRERAKTFQAGISAKGKSFYKYEADFKKVIPVEKELPLIIKWLISVPKPIGILAWNDDRSEILIEACKMAEIKIPEEVALLGIDNDEFICNLTSIPLSSIEMQFEKAGFEAAVVLNQLINGQKPKNDRICVHPLRVVKRKSTDILAYGEPQITAAVKFIRENVHNRIRVDDVVNQTYLSKRTLQKRFKKITGKSIQQMIIESRADKAAEMLLKSNLTVSQIAYKLNYCDVADFVRSFKKSKKISPLEYRYLGNTGTQ